MIDEKPMIEKITQDQINDNSVGKLSTRPNAPTEMGGNGMSAADLRARFDALAILAIEKINELLAYLNGDELKDGTTAPPFSSLIKYEDEDGVKYTLEGILESLQNGGFFPVDQSFDPESTSPQSGTAVTEAINKIGLFAMYTLEPQDPISAIVQKGYDNALGIEYFNRTPIVGDIFYCFGISNDGVSFHMTAQVTGFVDGTNGKINASFVALEVVAEKAKQVFDGTSIHAQSGKAVAEAIEKSESETKKYVDDKLEDFDIGDKVTVDPTYSPTSPNAQSGTAVRGAIGAHSVDTTAHQDIRLELSDLSRKITNFLDIDEPTLDQLSELIQSIRDNEGNITSLTNGKVNVADIISNLETNVGNKPLSAAMGVKLKQLIDDLAEEKEVFNITQIDTTYDTAQALPIPPEGNGACYLVKGEKALYAYDGTTQTWTKKHTLKAHTLYCVLKGDKAGLYRYSMADPYLVTVESHTLQEAKDYTDQKFSEFQTYVDEYILNGEW